VTERAGFPAPAPLIAPAGGGPEGLASCAHRIRGTQSTTGRLASVPPDPAGPDTAGPDPAGRGMDRNGVRSASAPAVNSAAMA